MYVPLIPRMLLEKAAKQWYSSFENWWHTVTHGRGSEGETGEWSG